MSDKQDTCSCPVASQVKSFNTIGIVIASFGALVTTAVIAWLQGNYHMFWKQVKAKNFAGIGPEALSSLTGQPTDTQWNKPLGFFVVSLAVAALICSSIGASPEIIGDKQEDLKKRAMLFIPALISSLLILLTAISVTWSEQSNIKHLPIMVIVTTVMITLSVFIFILAFV